MTRGLPAVPRRGAVVVSTRLAAIDRARRHAALATDDEGHPYLSLVAFALDTDGVGVFFATPRNSRKYRNLRRNPSVSLLLDTRGERDRDYGAAEAVTLMGRASILRAGTAGRREAEGILLAKHPALTSFVRAPTTAIVRVAIEEAVHVGGFQQITRWRPEQREERVRAGPACPPVAHATAGFASSLARRRRPVLRSTHSRRRCSGGVRQQRSRGGRA